MEPEFLHELARQIKRHPESYPRWVVVMADDVIEAGDNISRRATVPAPQQSDLEADFARRALSS